MPTRVVIVSHPALIRGMLSSWTRSQPDLEWVGEAAAADALPSAVDADLCILATRDCTTFPALQRLRESRPRLRILLVASCCGDYLQARGAGVVGGMIHESDSTDVLRAAIAAVAGGGIYRSAAVLRSPTDLPLRALTPRELEIFEASAAGCTDDAAGKRLGCGSATAEKHRQQVMRKLGTRDRLELVILGLQMGVVSVDQLPIGVRYRRSSSRRAKP